MLAVGNKCDGIFKPGEKKIHHSHVSCCLCKVACQEH